MTSLTISAPVDGQWYDLPTPLAPLTAPQIMFHLGSGVEETGPGSAGTRLVAGPNPCRTFAAIRWEGVTGSATAVVLDASGRQVRRLVCSPGQNGALESRWDCNDNRGRRVPAGVYAIRLASANRTACACLVVAD
jgi:hypothetical protein